MQILKLKISPDIASDGNSRNPQGVDELHGEMTDTA